MKKTKRIVTLVAACLCLAFAMSMGGAVYAEPYNECIDDSDGHGHIESVQWVCGIINGGDTGNVCSLWIGEKNDSTDIDITTSKTEGSLGIKFWGMCYRYENTTGLITVSDDNGSINDSKSLTRGDWGEPNGINTTLDIKKFISGVTPTEVTEGTTKYNKYTRVVNVGRCYGGTEVWTTENNVCSSMPQTISVTIKSKVKNYRVRAWAVRQGDGAYINVANGNVGGVKAAKARFYDEKHAENSKVEVSAKDLDSLGWEQSGWRTTRKSGDPSGGSKYTIAKITEPEKLFATYKPKEYKLSITQENATATVTRTSTRKTTASLGQLSDGAKIYHGDELTINFDKNGCYNWSEHTVDGTSQSSGYTMTVTADTAVVAKASLRSYTLSIDKGTGTTNTVSRTSSPYGGGGLNTLANRATIYCGDVLNASFGLEVGYSWSETETPQHSFVGNGINDTTHTTITGHTVDANVSTKTRATRNEFAGKLEASGGGGIDWTEDTTGPTNGQIDCDNYDTGCTATFQPRLRTEKGSGATSYSVQRSKNGGTWTNVSTTPAAPLTPSKDANGTAINETSGNYNEKLYPGEKVCYRMAFYPYGAKSNTTIVTLSACVTAKTSTFKGAVKVTGATSGDTGLVNSSATKRYAIYGCTAAGCKIRFHHAMERAGSIGSSGWTISRTSNLTDTSAKIGTRGIAIQNNTNVASGTFRPSTDTSQNNSRKTVKDTDEMTLYPGMVVCEKITFDKNNTYNSTNPGSYTRVYSQACVMALGNGQPDEPGDPDGPEDPGSDETSSVDDSFLNMKVRNASVSKWSKYQHMVYAKPGDSIRFRATYNPILQYTYYIKAERVKINGGTASPSSGRNTVEQLGAYFNTLNGCNSSNANVIKCWNNGFGVTSNFTNSTQYNFANIWNNGNTAKRIVPLAAFTVRGSDAGKNGTGGAEKTSTAKTNSAYKNNANGNRLSASNPQKDDRTTASQVTFDCDSKSGETCTDGSGNNNVGDVQTTQRAEDAYFAVPYNFRTAARITTDESKPVYAGEATTINYEIDIIPKSNSETMNTGDSNYATKADEVRRELVVYRPTAYTEGRKDGGEMVGAREADVCSTFFGLSNNETNCGYVDPHGVDGETLENDDNNRNGTKTHPFNGETFYAQDMLAGEKICVAVAVFPANSGAATNYADMQYSKSWTISPSKCFTIAKKPSLQVWGGNIYSARKIDMAEARKNNLKGYTDSTYRVGTRDTHDYIFGSWGELGLVSSGEVKGMSSGATIGYDGAFPTANPGGLKVNAGGGNICVRSVLTFANQPCNNNTDTIGDLGNKISTRNARSEKEEIIEKFTKQDDGPNVSGDVNLDTTSGKMIEDSVYYYYGNGSFALSGGRVQKGLTKVVRSDETITITNNVTYENGYNNYENIPKLVVYAKNIIINCDVERIDGLLIADKVVTCNNFDGVSLDASNFGKKVKEHINDPINSTPLKVNGAIVTDALVANRTYGAATGNNSIVSAETINFDPQLYKWGGQKIEGQTVNVNLDTVYSRELAPRL